MTKEQKEQIRKLRCSGYGYATIAEALGLTKNQVSAFCRRDGIAGNVVDGTISAPNTECCRGCGKALKQVPGRKEIKFCSDACRRSWWNSHLDQVNRKAIYEYRCSGCGKVFTAYGNSKRKYCSHACYIRARFKGGAAHE